MPVQGARHAPETCLARRNRHRRLVRGEPARRAATCWLSVTRDGRVAFVSNTGSGTLSAYEVSASGALSLSSAVAAKVSGSGPIDAALSPDGSFLYVDDSARGRILSFTVQGAGLQSLATVSGLPATIQGIAVE
ncbi:MAG TPA: beta-propeller fold lactonase family protein [Steroidobacteraceae bacterium]|nr:beta-propeller fold lactonase family protein [Steroidobacteraceae bacterium]